MLNFWHDTGPPTTSWDSASSESIPDADSSFESTNRYSPSTPSLKIRQKRRSRWRHLTDSTNSINSNDSSTHSFISCKFLLFILAFASLPLCSSGRTTIAPSFKADPSVLATFTDNYESKDVELEKMIMDPLTNRLYVGGVNHLYDLSPVDLQIREHSVTGPRPDSILCADVPRSCPEQLVQTNSYTKALAIDQESNKLIECTSLFQGRCRTRNLSNIRREADVHLSQTALVANDQHSSTVVFVGKGPVLSTSSFNSPIVLTSLGAEQPTTPAAQSKVLYVASTFVPTNQGPRNVLNIPSVSSLSLDPSKLFELTSQTISAGTYMNLDYINRPHFPIDYVAGFEANAFAYFATRQQKYIGDNQPTISKLVRVCTKDPNFYSYTEAPLECMNNGVHYNLLQDIHVGLPGFDLANSLGIKVSDQVLFGVFSRGDGPERNVSSRDSALCIFTLKDIEEKFFENIRECYNGNTRTNLPWFNSDKKCVATRYPSSEITCGKDVNAYIGGEIPIVSHATLTDQGFTSIVVTSVQSATVALIGTSGGQILKVLIEAGNGQKSRIYKTIQLTDGAPLLQDMALDEKNGLVYAMSRSTIFKVNFRHCSSSIDCHGCLEVGDPFCGWCLRQSQCITEESCIGGEIRDANNQKIGTIPAKNDWFNYKSGRCPIIQVVEPTEQQVTASKILNIRMENLPSALEGFSCAFTFPNKQTFKAPATVTSTGVTCQTPIRPDLKSLGSDSPKSVTSRLTVVKVYDNSPLASTNFTFYDCHQLSSCTECASSRFPCDWCTLTSKCVPNAEDLCQGEPLVNSIGRQGRSTRRGPDFCPRFASLPQQSSELFVASGHKRQLSFRAHNLHDAMRNFKCQYTVDGTTHERAATRTGDKIHCDEMRFEFFGRGLGNGTAIALFSVVWWPDSGMMLSRQTSKKDGTVGGLISAALSARNPDLEEKPAKITVGPGNKLDNAEDFHVIIYSYMGKIHKGREIKQKPSNQSASITIVCWWK